MVDDHKFSLNRTVAYRHPDPEHEANDYGPGGPERTSGVIIGVRLVEDGVTGWRYTIRNIRCDEVREVAESDIFHGTDERYLDLRRRDGIAWSVSPSDPVDGRTAGRDYQGSLNQFIKNDIPKLLRREEDEERAIAEGRDLHLAAGDYIKVRGDLRPEAAPFHNLYAKILSVADSDVEKINSTHKVRAAYHVLLDNGTEADIYDPEVKVVFTTDGRATVLNWRAAVFLAEAFDDDPPYDLQLDYLNGHVFSRAELENLCGQDLSDLLAAILYVKGLITWGELPDKRESLAKSPAAYLRDQILAYSRFDMAQNRQLTPEEVARVRAADQRLRDLIE